MTKQFSNYSDLITFTRASGGHALRPVSYGDELLTNGTFDTDSDWTLDTGWAISNGELVASSASTGNAAYQNFTTVVGKTYIASVDCSAITQGTFRLYWRVVGGAFQTYSDIVAGGTTTLTFVATSTSTRINVYALGTSSGVFDNVSVKEVTFDESDGTLILFEHPDDVPRVEWDSAGNRLGLLVEEARTNLVTYSEDFSNAAWAKSAAGTGSIPVITSNYALAPDGTNNASRIQMNAGSGTTSGDYSLMRFTVSSAPTTLTNSLWIKSNTGSSQTVKISYGASDAVHTATTQWQRFDIVSGNPNFADVVIRGDQTASSVDLLIWGYQAESGSFPTSYIKSNSGSTTTRSADVASIPVADFGYNQSAGTFFVEYTPQVVSADVRAAFDLTEEGGSTDNRIYHSGGTGVHWLVRSGASLQASLDAGTATANQLNKAAGVYKLNDFAVTIDGGTVSFDTSGVVPVDIGILYLGKLYNGYELNGHIKSIKYYPRRLTNAQLQDLTS